MKLSIFYDKNPGYLKKMQSYFEKEFKEVDLVQFSGLSLFSDNNSSKLLFKEKILGNIDGAYIHSSLKLAEFVEPLLNYFETKGTYVQCKPQGYYMNTNEALAISVLANYNFRIPETSFFGNISTIEANAKDFSYPLLFKTFAKNKSTEKLLIESARSLKFALKGKKIIPELFEIREYIEKDLIHCAVIGENVFAIRRKVKDGEFAPLSKGKFVKLSNEERENAILSLKALGLDIGAVKICDSKILKVLPFFDYNEFGRLSGDNLFSVLAKWYSKKCDKK